MRRHFAGIIMLLFLGTVSWGQGTRESFDTKKSREELEIMGGILSTTLKFVSQNSQTETQGLRSSNLNSFYLAGQGAVFVIQTYKIGSISAVSPFSRMGELYSLEASREAVRAAQEALSASSGIGSGAGGGIGSGVGPYIVGNGVKAPAPPVPPAPPAPPAAPTSPAAPAPPAAPSKPEKPARPEVNREELRKCVEAAKDRMKKALEEAETSQQKFLQSLSEMKVYLIEALANYGDSMTTVKSDEYVNLVIITTDRSDVVSARKSWITDYKAGKMSLESFKQKVIQYTE